MQYQPAGPAAGPPLYAPTPLLQPAHPTPFYIDDILGRGAPGPPPPPPSLPSPNSSFTSLVASYRGPVYEPTPLHPAFSHHLAAAAAYGSGPYGAPPGSPLYPAFPRAVGDYSHALLRHDPLLGKHHATPPPPGRRAGRQAGRQGGGSQGQGGRSVGPIEKGLPETFPPASRSCASAPGPSPVWPGLTAPAQPLEQLEGSL